MKKLNFIYTINFILRHLCMANAPFTFDELYHSYSDMVYNLAYFYTLHYADAEDITQEVFIKVHKQLNQYNAEKSSIKTWIYRITINQSLDHLRAKKTKKRWVSIIPIFGKDSGQELDIRHDDHPEHLLEQKEALEKLMTIIHTLPDNQRTAIILTKIEHNSQKEAAEIMGIHVKALESLLIRAKQSIYKKLQNQTE